MPPKKSGKKKGGKKSGKKSAKPPPAPEPISDLSKEFYCIQIKDLENRLARYQHRCDELEVENGQYTEKYTRLEAEKKDIVDLLKKEIAVRNEEITNLKERSIGLEQIRDHEKEQYASELQKLRTSFQEMKDQLTSDNMILGGKLASLEEFKVQKEDLMAKMAGLEEEITKQEDDHKEEIYKIERKQVVDKDRLKKEMVMRVNQVAAEFRKVSNKQMAETTKRTIRENVSINAQLGKMSDKITELVQENDELKAKEKKQKQIIEILEETEKELAKKNHSNQKIIRMLTEKCKDYEAQLQEYESRDEQYQELEMESDLLRQQVESTREELLVLSKENEQFEEDLSRMRSELEQESKNKRKLEHVLRDAAAAMKLALSTNSAEDVEESVSDLIEKRNNMLENMLIILNSAAALGVGPGPAQLMRSRSPLSGRERTLTSPFPGSVKSIKRGEMPMSPIARQPNGTDYHYKPGDFGLIPRPDKRIQTNIEKMHELSQTTRLGTLRKVLTKSIGVQTVSSPKAMFFADQLMSKMPSNTKIIHELAKDRSVLPSLTSSKLKMSSQVF